MSELRARIESIRQEHSMEDDFMKELQQKYDRDMATLEEEYRKTKAHLEAVSVDIVLILKQIYLSEVLIIIIEFNDILKDLYPFVSGFR